MLFVLSRWCIRKSTMFRWICVSHNDGDFCFFSFHLCTATRRDATAVTNHAKIISLLITLCRRLQIRSRHFMSFEKSRVPRYFFPSTVKGGCLIYPHFPEIHAKSENSLFERQRRMSKIVRLGLEDDTGRENR